MTTPEISVVIPVYNEQESLPSLFAALYPVMTGLARPFEIIFVNDGSRDKTLKLLTDFHEQHKDTIVVVDLAGNFGQHTAIMAGFERVRGSKIITLDADMQNPPEEIPKIITQLDAGHDVVGTYREHRQDTLFRKVVSKIANTVTNRITRLQIQDYGCMLRGYDRRIVDIINQAREATTFLPALGQNFAAWPIEIPVAHRERALGESKYGFFQLLRLNFDLMTSFSIVPLQIVTMLGIGIAALSFLFVIYMAFRRLIVGPEVDGVFTLMAIQFFLTGVSLSCTGVCGEYIGRIHREVSRRPRYAIRKVLSNDSAEQ